MIIETLKSGYPSFRTDLFTTQELADTLRQCVREGKFFLHFTLMSFLGW
jgi:hypothetical protein